MITRREEQEAKVRALQIRPLKGGQEIGVQQAVVTWDGVETIDGIQDHGLFVADKKTISGDFHPFLTQRPSASPKDNILVPGEPRLAQIQPILIETSNSETKTALGFRFNGNNEVRDPGIAEDRSENTRRIQLWEYRGKGIEVPALSEWLSDNLGRDVLVVRTSGPWDRMSRQNFLPNPNPLRAQDGYPIHVINWEDVVATFKVLGIEPDPLRFRAQFIAEGLGEREINDYARAIIRISDSDKFWTADQPKPCERCGVTSREQRTGLLSKYIPMAAWAKLGWPHWLRSPDKKARIFGENWLPNLNEGERMLITLEDTITFKELRNPPLQYGN